MEAIGCPDVDAYRALLADGEEEWNVLDALCRVTISRFYRDRHVFDALRDVILPELARARRGLRCLSIGCASGEEPYTVSLLWHMSLAEPERLDVIGTDIDPALLSRAKKACYPRSSLRDLPAELAERAFSRVGDELCLYERFRAGVEFRLQDVREELPEGVFDLILCRNLVFTYFEESLQHEIGSKLVKKLCPGGALVVGEREKPVNGSLEPWIERSGIYRKHASA